jgi:hypothetical protein
VVVVVVLVLVVLQRAPWALEGGGGLALTGEWPDGEVST